MKEWINQFGEFYQENRDIFWLLLIGVLMGSILLLIFFNQLFKSIGGRKRRRNLGRAWQKKQLHLERTGENLKNSASEMMSLLIGLEEEAEQKEQMVLRKQSQIESLNRQVLDLENKIAQLESKMPPTQASGWRFLGIGLLLGLVLMLGIGWLAWHQGWLATN